MDQVEALPKNLYVYFSKSAYFHMNCQFQIQATGRNGQNQTEIGQNRMKNIIYKISQIWQSDANTCKFYLGM